ncbi:MAG TPA: hypothetical protein VE224_17345 [Pseudolabrys sp.]|nr:hypothetical protein [Pseudolabrys sp.]
MFTVCKRTLNDAGDATDTACCTFEARSDAVSYLNKVTQFLRPDAGYEDGKGYWWVRNNGVVTRLTIRS